MSTKILRILSLPLVLVVSAAPLRAQPPRLKPGQYEVAIVFSVPGRSEQMPERKETHCYTAKEVDDLAKTLAGNRPAQSCKVVSAKTTGAVSNVTSECTYPDGNVMTSTTEIEFTSAESFHAKVHFDDKTGRSGSPFQNATITMNAKRIGDCSK